MEDRSLSRSKQQSCLSLQQNCMKATKKKLLEKMREALYFSKIMSYAQGFAQNGDSFQKEYELGDWNRPHDRQDFPCRLYHPRPFPSENHGSL
ncbi:MAG: hypothetical protein U5K84_05410 [Alkalibacterium sp.]|nr:hypothetical protein [Alkalibacterium sp.]